MSLHAIVVSVQDGFYVDCLKNRSSVNHKLFSLALIIVSIYLKVRTGMHKVMLDLTCLFIIHLWLQLMKP